MKILVDKMPKNSHECPFSNRCIFKEKRYYSCQFSGLYVETTCPENCDYLAKGVAAYELAVEADGEAEAGKAV